MALLILSAAVLASFTTSRLVVAAHEAAPAGGLRADANARGLEGPATSATDARVVIGGAGFAGIAAGRTLSEHGVDDFVIAEASALRRKAGGRRR